MVLRIVSLNRKIISHVKSANVLKHYSTINNQSVNYKSLKAKREFTLQNKSNFSTTRYQFRSDKYVDLRFIVDKQSETITTNNKDNFVFVGPEPEHNNNKYKGASIIAYCADYASHTTNEYAKGVVSKMAHSRRSLITELTSSLKGTGLGVIYNSKMLSRHNVECANVDSLNLKEDSNLIHPVGIPLLIFPTERMKLVDFYSKVSEVLTIPIRDDDLAPIAVTFVDHLQDFMEHFLCLLDETTPRMTNYHITDADNGVIFDKTPPISHELCDLYIVLVAARAYLPPHSKKAQRLTQALKDMLTLYPNINALLATDNHVRRLVEDSLCRLPLPYGISQSQRRYELINMVEKVLDGRELTLEEDDSEDQQFVFLESTPQ